MTSASGASGASGASDVIARANLLLSLRRPAEAEKETRRALADDPENADLHLVLARALSRQRDTDEALDAANRAVSLSPGFWYAHWVAGDVLSGAGREREALAAFQNALACDAEKVLIYEGLARGHYVLGEWPRVIEAAEQGLSRKPDDGFLLELTSLALVKVHDHARAREHAARALRLAPESASAHRTYGIVAMDTGDHKGAAEAFREALRLAPESGKAARLLLELHRRRNRLRGLDRVLWKVRCLPRRRMMWWIVASIFAPWFAFMILVTLGMWVNGVVRSVTAVWMSRDPLVRRLLSDVEVRSGRIAVGALGAGAVMIGTSAVLGSSTLALSGAATLALITPVHEAGWYERPGHTVFLGVAAVLAGFVVVLTALAFAAPQLGWVPVATLLTCYAGLGFIWPAMLLPDRPA